MEPTDLELLTAYHRQGSQSAFSQLVDRHAGWIGAAARRRLRDEHLADDATQAVFVTLLRKTSQLVDSARVSLSPWLFHVMHFTCARLRRLQSRQEHLSRAAGENALASASCGSLSSGELLMLLEDSIAELPPVDREMVLRRYYQHQSFAHIGDATGTSAEAARKRVSRAMTAIRSSMISKGGEIIPEELLLTRDRFKRELPAAKSNPAKLIAKGKTAMAEQKCSEGGYNLISVEYLVKDVEANLEYFEKLGFPRRWLDEPEADGRLPRASLTAGAMGKIWVRRAPASEIRPSSSISPFFWVDGGPDALIAHRKRIADQGIAVTPIIDEHALPNFSVTTPDGYAICFFTQYV